MSPVRFFRLGLTLPIITPLILLPFGMNFVMGILFIALVFGGVQYLVFAAYLFFQIGQLQTAEKIRRLSFWSPVLFVPVQALGWILSLAWEWAFGGEFTFDAANVLGPLLLFAVYTLVIGYLYVGLVNILYLVFKKKLDEAVLAV